MATWTNTRLFACCDSTGDLEGRVGWSYNTVADILTLKTHWNGGVIGWGTVVPTQTEEIVLGASEAEAIYKAMREWVRVYHGEKVLSRLDAEAEA